MILVDTSVWIDHLRAGNPALAAALNANSVLVHPFVVGEIALGALTARDVVLTSLRALPQAITAANDEVLDFIDQEKLSGAGIGYIDAHLLAAVRLTPESTLWTRDKRLLTVAKRLGSAMDEPAS